MTNKTDDEMCNFSANEHFQDVLERSLQSPQRRLVMRGGIGLFAASALPTLGCGSTDDSSSSSTSSTLGFEAVGKSLLDNVILPSGYTYSVLHATGDRLDSTVAAYSNVGTEADDWSRSLMRKS